eukprot:Gb_13299 [translate_table: standard]
MGKEEGNMRKKGKTVMVGVKLATTSREVLTWTPIKVACLGDHVIALHVVTSPNKLAQRCIEAVMDYLALGIESQGNRERLQHYYPTTKRCPPLHFFRTQPLGVPFVSSLSLPPELLLLLRFHTPFFLCAIHLAFLRS